MLKVKPLILARHSQHCKKGAWAGFLCSKVPLLGTGHPQPACTRLRHAHCLPGTPAAEASLGALSVARRRHVAPSQRGVWGESLNLPKPQFSALSNGANEPCPTCFMG